jgi:hypothetical protein
MSVRRPGISIGFQGVSSVCTGKYRTFAVQGLELRLHTGGSNSGPKAATNLGIAKSWRNSGGAYSVYYGDEVASSSVSDADRYDVVRKLSRLYLTYLTVYMRRWKLIGFCHGNVMFPVR